MAQQQYAGQRSEQRYVNQRYAGQRYAGQRYTGYLIVCTELLVPYKSRPIIGAPDVDVRVEACHLGLASNGKDVWNRRTLGLHDVIEPDSWDDVERVLKEEAKARCAYLLHFGMPTSGKAFASDLVQRVAAYIPRAVEEAGLPLRLLPPAGINMKKALWPRENSKHCSKRVRRYINSPSRDGK